MWWRHQQMKGRSKRRHSFRLCRLRLTVALCCLSIPVAGAATRASESDGVDWDKERQFWSFRPLANPSLPSVEEAGWPRQPLDCFILAKLEEQALRPAVEADRAMLIRRVTFDLAGLPPTPEEAADFCGDPTPDAFERL